MEEPRQLRLRHPLTKEAEMKYILIVVSHVYLGQVVTTQEFDTPAACERAVGFVADKDKRIYAAYLPKGS
jgi:hypothetical protein